MYVRKPVLYIMYKIHKTHTKQMHDPLYYTNINQSNNRNTTIQWRFTNTTLANVDCTTRTFPKVHLHQCVATEPLRHHLSTWFYPRLSGTHRGHTRTHGAERRERGHVTRNTRRDRHRVHSWHRSRENCALTGWTMN